MEVAVDKLESPVDALELIRGASGALDMSHVTTFKGYRKNKLGEEWLVTIEIRDAGPSTPHGIRYVVFATDAVGRTATGNGDERLDTALAGVHWSDLDNKPPASR
jgi:hypothetical protein